jgi:hypothetical protein
VQKRGDIAASMLLVLTEASLLLCVTVADAG